MKKSLVKVAALSLSATILFGVAGCSKKDTKESKKERSTEKATVETEEIEEIEETVAETSGEVDRIATETTIKVVDPDPQNDIGVDELQMSIIISNRAMWDYGMKGDQGTAKYAITDLDDDGNYEVIASLEGGSLLNTDSNMYEVDPDSEALVLIGAWTWSGETEDDVELDWTDSVYCWVTIDGNYVYAVHNYINLGSEGTLDKVYHVTFTDDGLTDEYVAVKRSGHAAEEDGEISDSMGNEEDIDFFDAACFTWFLLDYEECDSAYIEWIPMDGGSSYSDMDIYYMLISSWSGFNLHASVG